MRHLCSTYQLLLPKAQIGSPRTLPGLGLSSMQPESSKIPHWPIWGHCPWQMEAAKVEQLGMVHGAHMSFSKQDVPFGLVPSKLL